MVYEAAKKTLAFAEDAIEYHGIMHDWQLLTFESSLKFIPWKMTVLAGT